MTIITHEPLPLFLIMHFVFCIIIHLCKTNQNTHSIRSIYRENFLHHFTGNDDLNIQEQIALSIETEEKSLLGFCVLGGIFSEGIDLKEDSLIGVIIVGTGLPLVCPEREILKNYFEQEEGNGLILPIAIRE